MFDYNSPKELADYLAYLSKNSTAYNSYFEWRKYIRYQPNHTYFNPICDMCIKLQLESYFGIEQSIIQDLDYYWNDDNLCLNPKNINILNKISLN